MMQRIKAAVAPTGIMNPGMVLPQSRVDRGSGPGDCCPEGEARGSRGWRLSERGTGCADALIS